jgi:RNA polymerase sigma factor (sigma-70 family)
MLDDQPYLLRPEMDERAIAREMMHDKDSEHWKACNNFVNHCVHAKATNIPIDYHEDIAQEVMYKIERGLPGFRCESTLKGWVNIIIERCIIDAHRKLQNEVPYASHLAISAHDSDPEGEEPGTSEAKSAEDAFLINDEIRNGWAALLEYANTHANPIRNQLIIRMVIYEGRTYAEAAKAAGCSEPVVGYVVREAQRYAREKGH